MTTDPWSRKGTAVPVIGPRRYRVKATVNDYPSRSRSYSGLRAVFFRVPVKEKKSDVEAARAELFTKDEALELMCWVLRHFEDGLFENFTVHLVEAVHTNTYPWSWLPVGTGADRYQLFRTRGYNLPFRSEFFLKLPAVPLRILPEPCGPRRSGRTR